MSAEHKPHSTQNVPPGIAQRVDWWLCGQLLAEPAVLLRELLDEHRNLEEQFDALDDAIRDALDFLPEPPEHPNGATREQKASWVLYRALEQNGAQLSNPASESEGTYHVRMQPDAEPEEHSAEGVPSESPASSPAKRPT